jgi:hypothetical protein
VRAAASIVRSSRGSADGMMNDVAEELRAGELP